MTAPRPPLPDDLQRRLDTLLAKPALNRFPRLCEAITALTRDAFGRQPRPETIAAMQRLLAEAGLNPAGRAISPEPPHLRPLQPKPGFPAAERFRSRYTAPFGTGAPWRSGAEAEWDASRDDAR